MGVMTDDDWHWSRYWQADRLSACPADGATGNYVPAIHAGWTAFFGSFRDGASLLDIGTGNGAIAILAHATAAAKGLHFDIHAVDRADIDPTRFVKTAPESLAEIQFLGKTPAESLPFPQAHFDGISGQYALEYTDMPAAVRELCRVAKPGAYLRFVLHANGAVPVEGAARDLQEIDFLTRKLKLSDKARALMRAAFAFERAAAYDSRLEEAARRARQTYLEAARQADEHYPGADSKTMFADLLGGVRTAWDHRHELTLDYILEGIDATDTEILAHAARLTDMRKAALSSVAVEELADRFRTIGCTSISFAELRPPEDPRFWGWELTMRAN
jgi:SAM-dependent methyltransferase